MLMKGNTAYRMERTVKKRGRPSTHPYWVGKVKEIAANRSSAGSVVIARELRAIPVSERETDEPPPIDRTVRNILKKFSEQERILFRYFPQNSLPNRMSLPIQSPASACRFQIPSAWLPVSIRTASRFDRSRRSALDSSRLGRLRTIRNPEIRVPGCFVCQKIRH